MDAAEHLKGMAYHEAGHAVVANKAQRVGLEAAHEKHRGRNRRDHRESSG